jgi:hypothetical protein
MLCLGFLLELELADRRLRELVPDVRRVASSARAANVARLAHQLEVELDELVAQAVARFARR